MSVGMMEERGAEVSLKRGMSIINIKERIAACGTRKNGLYHLDMAPMSDVAAGASLQFFHERRGHVNVAGVKRMIKNKDVDGIKCTSMVVKDICEPCVYGKAAMTPMPKVGSLALKPLAATHVQARQRRTSSHPMPNVLLLKVPPTRKLSVNARCSDVWAVFWSFVARAETVGCRFCGTFCALVDAMLP